MSSQTTSFPLLPGQTAGYDIIAVASGISVLSILLIVFHVVYMWASSFWIVGGPWGASKERALVGSQLGRYAICLLLSGLITGASGLISVEWARDNAVSLVASCKSQAILGQMGHFSTAYFTVTMTVHALATVMFRYNQSKQFGVITMAIGWLGTLAIGVAPMSSFGYDGFICAIDRSKSIMQVASHILPIYIAALICVVAAILFQLTLRGTVVFNGGYKFSANNDVLWTEKLAEDEYYTFVSNVAKSIPWYPIAYIILALPYAIIRLLDVAGMRMTFALDVFGYTCFYLLGFVNVVLLYRTYRMIGFVDSSASSVSSDPEKSAADVDPTPPPAQEKRKSMGIIFRKAMGFPKRQMTAKRNVRLANAIKAQPAPRVRNLTHQRQDSQSSTAKLVTKPRSPESNRFSSSTIGDSDFESVPIVIPDPILPPAVIERIMVTPPARVAQKGSVRRPQADVNVNEEVKSLSPPPRSARSAVKRRLPEPVVIRETRPLVLKSATIVPKPSSARPLPAPRTGLPAAPKTAMPPAPTPVRVAASPKSASHAVAQPRTAGAESSSRSGVQPQQQPWSAKEISRFSARPLPAAPLAPNHAIFGAAEEENGSSSSDYESEEDIPVAPKSAPVTKQSVSRLPKLSPIEGSSDSDTDAESQYPKVPAMVLPVHKRRPGYPSRPAPVRQESEAEYPPVKGNSTSGRPLPISADIGSSTAWANLATASLISVNTAPRTGALSAKRLGGSNTAQLTAQLDAPKSVPQLRTPASAQAPKLVIPTSPVKGAPASAHHYF